MFYNILYSSVGDTYLNIICFYSPFLFGNNLIGQFMIYAI